MKKCAEAQTASVESLRRHKNQLIKFRKFQFNIYYLNIEERKLTKKINDLVSKWFT